MSGGPNGHLGICGRLDSSNGGGMSAYGPLTGLHLWVPRVPEFKALENFNGCPQGNLASPPIGTEPFRERRGLPASPKRHEVRWRRRP